MIPKIIHYCWFGRGEKPKSVNECIATWNTMLPDYVIKEWNEDNFDFRRFPYAYEAYKLKKYAFVSDVARLYALSKEGGIYLDTDVRVLKSFNPYLSERSFLSYETPYVVSTAVIGSEPNIPWVVDFLESYRLSHFIRVSGMLKLEPNTIRLSSFLHFRYPQDVDDLKIYDIPIFTGKLFFGNKYIITNETVCVHEFQSSWTQKQESQFDRLRNLIIRYSKAH